MRTLLKAALVLACCAWSVHAQAPSSHSPAGQGESDAIHQSAVNASESRPEPPPPRSNVWGEPIRFNTKAKDDCVITVSLQGERTRLRVTCKSKSKSYWCVYVGKPNLCRSYSNNQHHYFKQIMWAMRKLPNACQGPRTYKPQMCRSAADDAQMVFQAAGPKTTPAPRPTSAAPKQTPPKPGVNSKQPAKPPKAATAKPAVPRKPLKSTTPRPTDATESPYNQLAEEYCWKSLQGICAYVISWFN